MKSEKDSLVPMSENQLNPYLCDPREFEVISDGQPFNGQCGANEREYNSLIKESEKVNAKSPFTAEAEVHPDVNRAGRPHGDGMGSRK